MKIIVPGKNRSVVKQRGERLFDSNFSSTKRSVHHDASSALSGAFSPNAITRGIGVHSTKNGSFSNTIRDQTRAESGFESNLPSLNYDEKPNNALNKVIAKAQMASKNNKRPSTQFVKKRNLSLQVSKN